jgi:hypothetical protein
MGPQFTACAAHDFGVQALPEPHTLGVPPPPHVPASHVPQSSWLPQPSPAGPQLAPSCAHVFGVQAGAPQTLAMPPPPQVCPDEHVPHCKVPPHPSPMGPHVAPSSAQVFGVQPASETPHRLGVPPAPHAMPNWHEPQSSMPPQPSPTLPHCAPAAVQVVGVQLVPSIPASRPAGCDDSEEPHEAAAMTATQAATRNARRWRIGWTLIPARNEKLPPGASAAEVSRGARIGER